MSFLKAGTLEDLRARYMFWHIQAKILFPKITPQERSTQGLSYYRMLYELFCFEQNEIMCLGKAHYLKMTSVLVWMFLAVTQWMP